MLPPTPVAIVLFALGIGFIIALARAFQRTRRLYRVVETAWQEAVQISDRRAERLPLLLKEAQVYPSLVPHARRLEESIRSRPVSDRGEDLVSLEQEISRQITRLASQAESDGLLATEPSKNLGELIAEFQEHEPFLRTARENYNEAATAWNTYRSGFPGNILAEARGWSPFPLFHPPS